MMTFSRCAIRGAAAALVAGWSAALRAYDWQVDVVTDVTPAGHSAVQPKPGKPVYYFPVVGGYREMGAVIRGEQAPDVKDTIHHLARVLADHGYLSSQLARTAKGATTLVPLPALVLVFNWGYLNPISMSYSGDPNDPNSVVVNQAQTLALVAGNTLPNLPPPGWTEFEDVMQGSHQDRYFVVVEAYDFPTFIRQRKKVLLWSTKMSIPTAGVDLPEVVPTLIAAGGPLFGVETTRPKWLMVAPVPNGHVEVGEPSVKDYIDTPPPAPAAGPAPAAK